MQRSAGMLLHISSLPGPYGIGRLGRQAADFALLLARSGFAWWQMLPFGPPAAGYSPYQCYSAFAGNPMLIDPDRLYEDGLITAQERAACQYEGSPHLCDFKWLEQSAEHMLRQAFERRSAADIDQMKRFVLEQAHWLPDYACFQTARQHFDGSSWWEWPEPMLVRHDPAAVEDFADKHRQEIDYHCFVQFLFDRQWRRTRAEIAASGVKLIGDIPIYVSLDSSDVWANRSIFEMDETMRPIHVAGVPPDYFTADGQLWGNPLFRWDVLEKQDYFWWVERIGHAFAWFDCLRLDHFRGFASYYAIRAGAKNAKKGQWHPGPGRKLFDVLFQHFDKDVFIAEDLGEIDAPVHQLLKDLGLPGMRVLQFGFDGSDDNAHLPFRYPVNSIAFTGTHDNNTLLGWLWSLHESERQFVLRYAGFEPEGLDWGQGGPHAPVLKSLIRTVWATSAMLAVAPIQDFLGYGSDTRMNTPGEPRNQWRFRVTLRDLDALDERDLRQLNRVYRRC